MEYTLVRSGRKSLSLVVTPQATLQVRAPHKLPLAEINRYVAAKSDWIARHIALQSDLNARRENFCLHYGCSVLYRGKNYFLLPQGNHAAGPGEDGFYVPENLDGARLMECVTALYRRLARKELAQRLADYGRLMGLAPTGLRISGAKTRWGSCSVNGNVSFSWRLILAEDAAIDSVVVHELAHLREFNHSPQFWAFVTSILPDYAQRQEGLRTLQERLRAERWA